MRRKTLAILSLFTIMTTIGMMAQSTFRLGSDSTDWGKDIVIDKDGNTVLTGSFWGTVDFDPGLGVHNLTSAGKMDNFIAKYGPSGNFIWAISFGGIGDDEPSSVKTDDNGNIYVCGYFSEQVDFDPGVGTMIRSSNGLKDAYVTKFDSIGNILWVNTFGGVNDDEVFNLRLDASNNLYVAGSFQGTMDIDPGVGVNNLTSNGGKDIFLLKYTIDGNLIWGFNVGGPGDDEGLAVVLDANGDCYLSGNFTQTVDFDPGPAANSISSVGGVDMFLCKYSSDGSLQWVKTFGGKAADTQTPGGIAIDVLQNIYITGGFSQTISFEIGEPTGSLTSHGGTDVFVAKFASDGTFLMRFGFGGPDQDMGKRVVVDPDGNILVTGLFRGDVDFDPGSGVYLKSGNGTNGASDIFTAQYDFRGNLMWADAFGAVTSDQNDKSEGTSVALDGLGNCYITGKFYRTADFDPSADTMNFISAGSSDIFVLKLDNIGMLWTSLNYSISYITPKSLNIGYSIVNSTRQAKFTVSNVGDVNLSISSVLSTNIKFSTSPSTATIVPLDSKEITVTFAPTDTGYQSSWIIINHNGLSHKDSVSVYGWGMDNVNRYNVSVSAGWNLISLPLIAVDGRKTTLFPTAITDAFAYIAGGYQSCDTMEVGMGYWLKFVSPQSIEVLGQARASDTIDVINGWNLIGAITYPVSKSSVIQIPSNIIVSNFFEYSSSYNDAAVLLPGKAYWVKVNQNGKLILGSP